MEVVKMAKTLKQLKKISGAIKDDVIGLGGKIKEEARDLKESALETAAKVASHVKDQGGVMQTASKYFRRGTGYTGQLTGKALRAGQAAYNTVFSDDDLEGIVERFKKFYEGSNVNPDEVRIAFEQAYQESEGAVLKLYGALKKGTDKVSREISSLIPSEEDYKVQIGAQTFTIGKSVLIKPDIEEAKKYVTHVADVLPSNFKGRKGILTKIAEKGIRSNEELKVKSLETYAQISKYVVT